MKSFAGYSIVMKFFRTLFAHLGSLLIPRSSREKILQSQVDLLQQQLQVVVQRHAAAVEQFNSLTQLIASNKAEPCPRKGRCATQSGPLLEFVQRLAECGGAIVCTSACTEMEIAFAVAEGRVWIDPETSIGYVRRLDKWRRLGGGRYSGLLRWAQLPGVLYPDWLERVLRTHRRHPCPLRNRYRLL